MTSPSEQGPNQKLLQLVQRILSHLLEMVEVRLQLIVTELEEEKVHLVRLLLLISGALLFGVVGFISLLFTLYYLLAPEYRLVVIGAVGIVALLAALLCLICASFAAKRSTLLKITRQQLALDKQQLNQASDHDHASS